MSSYINTKATAAYKDALEAVEGLDPPGLGFVRPESNVQIGPTLNKIIKQNNTLIELLVRVSESLETQQEVLVRHHREKEVVTADGDLEQLLKKVQEGLTSLSLGEDNIRNLLPTL